MRLRSSSLSLFRSSSKRPISSKVFLVPAEGIEIALLEGVKLYRYRSLLYGFIDVHKRGNGRGN